MLDCLHRLRVPVTTVLSDASITKAADQGLNLSPNQWVQVENLSSVLDPFKGVTVSFSASTKVTVSTILPLISGLVEECNEDDSNIIFVTNFMSRLRAELTGKFDVSGTDTGSCAIIAAALDPHFKSLLFVSDDIREDVEETLKLLLALSPGEPDSGLVLEPSVKCSTSAELPDAQVPPLKKQESLLSCLAGKHQATAPTPPSCGSLPVAEQLCLFRYTVGCSIDGDPLQWWRQHAESFPDVARLAKRSLCIPASSAESERNSSATDILTERRRSRLSSRNINMMLFLNRNGDLLQESLQTNTEASAVPSNAPFSASSDLDLPPTP